MLEDLESGPDDVRDRVEWATKKHYLDKIDGSPDESQKARNLDLRWDMLDPERGIGMKLRKTLWAKWMPPEQLIRERMTTPPRTTRAWVRGEVIRILQSKFPEASKDARIDWRTIGLPGIFTGQRFYVLDPYETEMPAGLRRQLDV